ncbi:MAG: 6-phosphogluconolactonase [Anaerolineales bacterium]
MISVYPDYETLSQTAARLFLERAVRASQAGTFFKVALSGGNTPHRTYELLAEPPFRDQVQWNLVQVFWGDERCVPMDDPRSNAHAAFHTLLDKVAVPSEQIHPISCASNPERSAREYETLLKGFFADQPPRFDLIFLGLGENGHTASLFPNTPVLKEAQRWVAHVYVREQDLYRVTLTAPLINQAALVVFLVAGSEKAHVLSEVREGSPEPERLPAQLIKPKNGELMWLVDEEAAAQLEDRPLESSVKGSD